MKTIIKNVHVLTMDSDFNEYGHGYILFEDDKILDVGSMGKLPAEASSFKIVDGEGAILMPGMINSHTHTGMIPFRTLKEDVPDRLRRFFFPLENHLSKEIVHNSAKYASAEMLLGGVTAFADMYYFENEIAEAVKEMKHRAILGQTVINFPVCDSALPYGGFDLSREFISKWVGDELITPAVAPHATYTNSKEYLLKEKALAEEFNVPILIHLSEMEFEMEQFEKEHAMSPVKYLDEIGFLNDKILAAHCIFLNDEDIDILNRKNVRVAHCIGANTKSAKGVARVRDLLNKGVALGLGTDGPASGNTLDIVTLLRIFAYFHKTHLKDNTLFTAREVLKIATRGGASALGLDKKIGSLEAGKKADFILVETDSVNMYPVFDAYSAMVYSANASNVRDVYVNGEAVVLGKKLVSHDLAQIRKSLDDSLEEFKNHAERLSQEVQ